MKTITRYFIGVVLCALPLVAMADSTQDDTRYRRLSLCNIMVKHDNEKFADEIEEQFLKIGVADQYNDHNLSVRVVNTQDKIKGDTKITDFVNNNDIASRLVAKWFNRDIISGQCDMELVKSRGLYDASVFDHELANRSARGLAMLEDAGEDLIGNTYLLMHEFTYIDKSKRSRTWGMIGGMLMAAASAYAGGSVRQATDMAKSTFDIISSYKGFSVRINTRLYQLVWDEEASNDFYTNYFTSVGDDAKRNAFENNRGKFRLKYVGNVISKGGTTSFLGINEEQPELMVRKACQRALDENVADLMKKYDQFRIKMPVASVSPQITVNIGLKEGVTPDSRYEVLEPQEKNGKVSYKRIAVIKPVPGRIWDNRYMASEERAYGADFGATTFVKESGDEILTGHLVRQIE